MSQTYRGFLGCLEILSGLIKYYRCSFILAPAKKNVIKEGTFTVLASLLALFRHEIVSKVLKVCHEIITLIVMRPFVKQYRLF